MMKRVFILLFGIVLSMNIGFVSNANEEIPFDAEDILLSSSEFEEIQQLEEEMEASLQNFTGEPVDITEEDYSRGVKVYVDADLTKTEDEKIDSVLSTLYSGREVWIVPYGEKYECTIAKGLGLSDDPEVQLSEKEKDEVLENEGKWMITSYGESTGMSYYSFLQGVKVDWNEYDRVILTGGQPGFVQPVAIGFNNGEAADLISVGYGYPVTDTFNYDLDELFHGAVENVVFDYTSTMKEAQNYTTDLSESDATGGGVNETGNISIFVVYAVISFLIIIGLCFTVRKIKKR